MNEQTSQQAAGSVALPAVTRRRWLTVVLTVVVFVSGLAIGSGLTFLYVDYRRAQYLAHPEDAPKRFAARLKRTLRLTDSQARQIQAIIEERWPKFQETRRQMYPAFKEHLDAIHAEVSAVLREDQRGRWDKYVETIRSSWNPPAPATTPGGEATSATSVPPSTAESES